MKTHTERQKKYLKFPRVIVWTGIWAEGVIGPFFIEAFNCKLETSAKHSYDTVWAVP
jgi:hypothetical protein